MSVSVDIFSLEVVSPGEIIQSSAWGNFQECRGRREGQVWLGKKRKI